MTDPEFTDSTAQNFDRETDNVMEEFALAQMTTHWRDFERTPEDMRIGGREFWESVLPDAVVDLGISRERANYLCELAKLDAQFDL